MMMRASVSVMLRRRSPSISSRLTLLKNQRRQQLPSLTRNDPWSRKSSSITLPKNIVCPQQTCVCFSTDTDTLGNEIDNKDDLQKATTALEQETQRFLNEDDSNSNAEQEVIRLVQEWLNYQEMNPDNKEQAAEWSEQLLRHWLQQQQQGKVIPPTTSLPFSLVMEAWRNAGNGHSAANVLDEWGYLLEGNLALAPTLEAFHVVMDAYSRSSDKSSSPEETITAVEELLLLLKQWYTAGNLWAHPQVETYAHVIRTLVKQQQQVRGNNRDDNEKDSWWTRTLDLLQELQQTYQDKHTTPTPNDVYYLIRAYGDVIALAVRKDPLRAVQLLEQLMKNHHTDLGNVAHQIQELDDDNESLESSLGRSYESVLNQLLFANKKSNKQQDMVATAERMNALVDQLELGAGDDWSVLPWPKHYEAVIEAWSSCVVPAQQHDNDDDDLQQQKPQQTHPQIFESLLNRMETRARLSKQNKLSLQPYEFVLSVWARCGQGDKAEALLSHVMKLQDSKQEALLSSGPDSVLTRCWNHTLAALLHEGHPDRVLQLWHDMKAAKVKADGFTYGPVLSALSQSSEPRAARKAQSLWRKMVDDYRTKRNVEVRPNAALCGYVIAAWSRSPERNAAFHAQALLDRLEIEYDEKGNRNMKPETAHYSAVITAWARSPGRDSAKNAEKVLERMKDRASFDESLRPDIVTYGAVLDALSRERSLQAAKRAQELLDHLESLGKEDGLELLQPNKVCYAAVMMAWARSGSKDAPERAQAVLKRLQHAYSESGGDDSLRPDTYSYGALLDAWANSRAEEAGERAEELLDLMENQASGDDSAPNNVQYTNAIRAHWGSGRPDGAEKAEAILNRMEERYTEGYLNAKPDTVAHTCVIQAWARSTARNKAQHAWDLLQRMCESYNEGNLDLRPNVITFTAVLNACAHTRGEEADRKQAINIALMAMKELQAFGTPSHITFRTLLEVFGYQILQESQRTKYSSVAFQRCCQEGQVDSSVVDALRRFAPGLYKKLPGDPQKGLQLPNEWSRNVDTQLARTKTA